MAAAALGAILLTSAVNAGLAFAQLLFAHLAGYDFARRLLARYVDVARCWESADATVHHTTFPGVSRFVGAMAEWKETHLNAEVHDDHVVLVSEHEPHAAFGFAQAGSGRWFREVPRADVEVDVASGQVTISSSAPIEPDTIRGAVEEAGYHLAQ